MGIRKLVNTAGGKAHCLPLMKLFGDSMMRLSTLLLTAILMILILQGWTSAERWADASISVMATGGENMDVSSTKEIDLQTSDDMVTNDYKANVVGSMVKSLDLTSSSLYAEDIDGEFRLIQSKLHQKVVLPGYFDADMCNEHMLFYISPVIWPPELQTEMAISTTDGKRILNVQSSMESEVDKTIDDALSGINQAWYDTYFAGSPSKELELAVGYETSFVQSSGNVMCNWGHEYSASKRIEFD